MSSLAERVSDLVKKVDGSVRSAAERVGVPHPSFARIVDGTVKNPRTDALTAIADAYNVSVDWLLTGKGKGPTKPDPADANSGVASFRWRQVVEGLGLPEPVRDDVLRLPHSLFDMWQRLDVLPDFASLAEGRELEPSPERDLLATLYAAADQERNAYITAFTALEQAYGKERLRDVLVAHHADVARRFVECLTPEQRTALGLSAGPDGAPGATAATPAGSQSPSKRRR